MANDNYRPIVRWEGTGKNKIPFDAEGEALDGGDLRDVAIPAALSQPLYQGQKRKEKKIQHARILTDPYGVLEYCIGSGEDFHCFDFAELPDGRVVIDATLNSETGAFIQSAGYFICTKEEAPTIAENLTHMAMDWMTDNDVRHDKRGWNQDPYYFLRAILAEFAGQKFRTLRRSKYVPDVPVRKV